MPQSQVAGDLLRRMGFNVDYQALEWGMVVARRASKEPPDKGGWNIFITNLTSFNNVFVPAQIAIRSGPNAWFGWPNAPKLEELREAWLDATTEEEQKRIVRDMQLQAWQDVPYVPLGTVLRADGVQQDAGRHSDGLAGVPRGAAGVDVEAVR